MSQSGPTPPAVDVVLPAYNGREVIGNAVASALAQEVPLRVIVVDDGSEDDSAAIARSYGSRVTVLSQANRGVSGARNAGLAAAQAPYVALLDQDDVWEPGKLARQLELIEAHPEVGLVFTDMLLLKRDGTVVEDGFLRSTPPYAALERQPLGNQAYLLPKELGEAVLRFNFISPSTTLLRRQAIQEIGAFDEAFRLCDDAECWMRLLCRWRGIAI
jgi:glycosyltransferase involved in cell wall biosynthesis